MQRAGVPQTRLLLLDLARPEAPRLLEQATYDGASLSARLVDGTVRLVTSSTPQPDTVFPAGPGPAAEQAALAANQQAALALPLEAVLPQVERRSGDGRLLDRGPAIDCDQVTHAADATGTTTLLVTTLRPRDGLAATDSTAVTASGDLVYASAERLYVATSRWGTTTPVPVTDLPGSRLAAAGTQVTTELHAFDTTSRTRTRYVGTGAVDGYVLGRWALSEHEGALRVATTLQPPWESAEKTSSSVVVLVERDGGLVETGRVDGLGRDERIQAVRYLGDLAAVVTFRQTDPLYLVDLSDRTAPRVLGELKVPGFSTYLHPLGDGLLLGVGQDATEHRPGDRRAAVGLRRARPVGAPAGRPAPPRSRVQPGARRQPGVRVRPRAAARDPGRSAPGGGLRDLRTRRRRRRRRHLREVGRMEVFGSQPDRVLSDGDRVYAVSQTGVVAGDAATMTRTGAVDVP